MPRKSEITQADALRMAYDVAASIIEAALRDGPQPGLSFEYDEDSVEARRILGALKRIAGNLHRRSISPPRRSTGRTPEGSPELARTLSRILASAPFPRDPL